VKHVALAAKTPADARDVMIEGPAGLIAISPPSERPTFQSSKRRVTWPNGCVGTVFSGENPEQPRGPQHQLLWADELAAWQYPEETWDNLSLGMRLSWADGSRARSVVTTTPRPLRALKMIRDDAGTVVTKGSTYENRGNLDPVFFEKVIRRYEGTRLGRQELDAEVLEDVVGALWSRAVIDSSRRGRPGEKDLHRTIVSVDPAASSGDESAETGIIVLSLGVDGEVYVLADRSCRLSPAGWAGRTIDAVEEFDADGIVAEANQGGEMVSHTIRTISPQAKVKLVHATKGKRLRAEPVSSLYEQKRVHHVGLFPQLEDQMVSFTGAIGETSPDRLDALVHGVTDLAVVPRRPRFTLG
jgi:phage terminase large subunit-like protein